MRNECVSDNDFLVYLDTNCKKYINLRNDKACKHKEVDI